MVTMTGNEKDLNELLQDIITLDFDAAEAYAAAIDRLDDAECRTNLALFREDHLRHTRELGRILTARGMTPPQEGDAKRLLTKGKVVVAGLAGDTAILRAMLSNEEDANAAYERAVANPVATPDARALLQKNLEDERRHKSWIENAIRMKKAA